MCFAPQRRALFWHLNLQKWREHVVFCAFSLRNVLRATTACTFSTSQLPKVVRTWCVLYILTSKCASRHNGVQLFISHLPRCLGTRRLSEPTFQPSGATKPRKKHVSRLSYLFVHLHLLSSDLFSSDSSRCWLLFHLSILSEVWLPNFLRLLTMVVNEWVWWPWWRRRWWWWWWWWNWRWSRRCRWGWRCNGTMAYAYTCSQTRAKHGPGGIEPGPW